MSRVAPSTVFYGERMHLGTSPRSSSLVSDYSTSLNAGQTSFTGSARLSVNSYDSDTRLMQFSWNASQPSDPESEDSTKILTAWLLFVEFDRVMQHVQVVAYSVRAIWETRAVLDE